MGEEKRLEIVPYGDGPVVMVDDNDIDRMLFQRCVARSRFQREVLTMASGQQLLDYLDDVECRGAPLPCLVLLDINMPGFDGFETLRRIRLRPSFSRVPVVMMLTNSEASEDESRAFELGADGFQTKPMSIEDYVEVLDRLAAGS